MFINSVTYSLHDAMASKELTFSTKELSYNLGCKVSRDEVEDCSTEMDLDNFEARATSPYGSCDPQTCKHASCLEISPNGQDEALLSTIADGVRCRKIDSEEIHASSVISLNLTGQEERPGKLGHILRSVLKKIRRYKNRMKSCLCRSASSRLIETENAPTFNLHARLCFDNEGFEQFSHE